MPIQDLDLVISVAKRFNMPGVPDVVGITAEAEGEYGLLAGIVEIIALSESPDEPAAPAFAAFFGGDDEAFVTVAGIDKLAFATNSMSSGSSLAVPRVRGAAVGSATAGYYGKGSDASFVSRNIIDKFVYATDAVSDNVAALNPAAVEVWAIGNATHGWFSGGASSATVVRIQYSDNSITTATSTHRIFRRTTACSAPTFGLRMGGFDATQGTFVATTTKYVFATGSNAFATTMGTPTRQRNLCASDTTHGYSIGGVGSSNVLNNTRYQFSDDTVATMTALALARMDSGVAYGDGRIVMGGGRDSQASSDFFNDLLQYNISGDSYSTLGAVLAVDRNELSAASSTHGGLP